MLVDEAQLGVVFGQIRGEHRMGRYYFHSVTTDGLLKDDIGVEVEAVDLKREATKAVFELEAEFVGDREELPVLGFRVVDDFGRIVLELPLREMLCLIH